MDLEVENLLAIHLDDISYMNTLKKYEMIYEDVLNDIFRELLTKLHSNITENFKLMNGRLPTNFSEAHFWADPSRSLIKCLEIAEDLYYNLKDTEYAIKIDEYYVQVFEKCNTFLSSSGGSAIPKDMDKIRLYLSKKIFILDTTIKISSPISNIRFTLKLHGEGSYAQIFRYKDETYNSWYIVKRAKDSLDEKELERFKIEYKTLKDLDSPYIIEVYNYNEQLNQYIMEYMDFTLDDYISKNNQELSFEKRKRIALQVFRAIEYIHSKGLLHRDISPNNVLLKKYDDGTLIVKISDFGLVKREYSELTSPNTAFKGSFNDPDLQRIGFDLYEMKHEIYALTYLVYFILTGRRIVRKTKNDPLDEFVDKGMNPHSAQRFKDVEELRKSLLQLTDIKN